MSEQDRQKDEIAEEPATLIQEAEAAIDVQRDQTSDALQSFADTIQEKTGSLPGDRTAEAGAVAAEQIERAADYVHEHRTQQVVRNVESVLRSQPIVAVAIGVGIGFVVGRMSK